MLHKIGLLAIFCVIPTFAMSNGVSTYDPVEVTQAYKRIHKLSSKKPGKLTSEQKAQLLSDLQMMIDWCNTDLELLQNVSEKLKGIWFNDDVLGTPPLLDDAQRKIAQEAIELFEKRELFYACFTLIPRRISSAWAADALVRLHKIAETGKIESAMVWLFDVGMVTCDEAAIQDLRNDLVEIQKRVLEAL